MKPSAKFDIVVYGATGFTGQLVAEYLAAHYAGKSDPKWAMAGRNLDKLASVRDAIGAPADTALIQADANDPASLKAMVDQTKSVLTTVGPYQLYGSELVAACAASGTDYLDLCGEPVWMRRMIDAHQAAAQSSSERGRGACQELSRRAGQPNQGPRPRHEGNVFGRHRGEHQGDIRGRRERPQPGGAAQKSVRVDTGLRRSKAAGGQQAVVRRRLGPVDGAVRDGDHQYPQRAPLQSVDGLSLRQRVYL